MAVNTPVVTKKQEKNTLSGKKKKPEVIKNVLAQPYRNHWPKLSVEDNNQLTETLSKLLPRLKPIKSNVPYRQIKDIPREDRKSFRKSFYKETPDDVTKREETNVIFGVNDTIKLIEKLEADAVLISSDVQPRLLVQHVIDQALLCRVPVLVVDELRSVCKQKCGISGAVMSFKKTVAPNSDLSVIVQAICTIADNYQKPQNHINSLRCLNLSTISINDSEDGGSCAEDIDEEVVESKNYHLKKCDGKKRAFIPEIVVDEKIMDFIKLDDSLEVSKPPTKKIRKNEKEHYSPLKVKRLKGNKNRCKRKMEKFVKKKK